MTSLADAISHLFRRKFKMATHTQLPWRPGPGLSIDCPEGKPLALLFARGGQEGTENLNLIVRSVNGYPPLLAAARLALAKLDDAVWHWPADCSPQTADAIRLLREALQAQEAA